MNARAPSPQRRVPRRGITILEFSMALLILSFAVGGLLQILTIAASHRRTTEARRLALEEIANQAEQIALVPWDDLTAEKLGARKPSEPLLAAVPTATITVKPTEEPGPPAARRIQLEVRWMTPAGDSVEPVRLTVWRHQPAEALP